MNNINLTSQRVVIVTLTSSGTDTYAGTGAPTVAAYSENALYTFKANHANTGACSINIDGVGAKTIKKVAGGVTTDLADNDIRSGQVCVLSYDGTNMQMQSTSGNAGGGGIGGSTGGTDNAVPRANGTGGATLEGTGVTIDDSNAITAAGGLISGYDVTVGTNRGLIFSSNGSIYPSGDGLWQFQSNSSTFNGIQFGGTTSSFPKLGRSADLLKVSAADGSSGGGLEMLQRAAEPTPASNSAVFYALDVAGTAEMFVVDEAGNETQISPHNHTAPASFVDSPFDVIGFESNAFTALVTYTHKSRQAAGRIDYLLFETFDEHNARLGLTAPKAKVQKVWSEVQAAHVATRDAERTAWQTRKTEWEADPAHEGIPFAEAQPALYVAKPQPQWLTDQLAGREAFLTARTATATKAATMSTKRTAVGQQVDALRQWKTDADNAVAAWDGQTTAQRFAALKVVINRFGVLSNHLADFIQAQGLDS